MQAVPVGDEDHQLIAGAGGAADDRLDLSLREPLPACFLGGLNSSIQFSRLSRICSWRETRRNPHVQSPCTIQNGTPPGAEPSRDAAASFLTRWIIVLERIEDSIAVDHLRIGLDELAVCLDELDPQSGNGGLATTDFDGLLWFAPGSRVEK